MIYPKVPEIIEFENMESVFLSGSEGFNLLKYS